MSAKRHNYTPRKVHRSRSRPLARIKQARLMSMALGRKKINALIQRGILLTGKPVPTTVDRCVAALRATKLFKLFHNRKEDATNERFKKYCGS